MRPFCTLRWSFKSIALFQRRKKIANFGGQWNTKKTSSSATSEIARRWSLLCSKSFKVNNAGTSRKPVCDFVRVNTTNLHRFPVIAHCWSNYRLWQGVPLVNVYVLGNLCEHRHKSHMLRTKFFGLHFCRRKCGCNRNQFNVKLAFQCDALSVITQNDGHYAVQGHSRSPTLVPFESSYATSH